MKSVLGECSKDEKDELAERFREVVGPIVVMFDMLSIHALSKLLGLEKDDIDAALRHLRSVLDVSGEGKSLIRLLHPSFRDFLLDNERCQDEYFWINGQQTHSNLSKYCLQIISSTLRRDMCRL
jgi:hypothetical protein